MLRTKNIKAITTLTLLVNNVFRKYCFHLIHVMVFRLTRNKQAGFLVYKIVLRNAEINLIVSLNFMIMV
jgi:hypothetical protein